MELWFDPSAAQQGGECKLPHPALARKFDFVSDLGASSPGYSSIHEEVSPGDEPRRIAKEELRSKGYVHR